MSDDEKTDLQRINAKLEDHSELLTEIRIAVARIEVQPVCKTPNLCDGLQKVLADHEHRLAHLEAIRNWTMGVVATVSLLAFLCWDFLKLWIKK